VLITVIRVVTKTAILIPTPNPDRGPANYVSNFFL
jgi:hypothetical protein